MIIGITELEGRSARKTTLKADLVVVGGGIAGVCTALSAAREGADVILVQDRPVLGGNASSEVRLWILGATSHMGNNNRWSREGGIVDELLTENLYRNKEGNPVLLDALLMDKVLSEKNITLLLNTVVTDVVKAGGRTISSVEAICPQNDTRYTLAAPLFCDASGDGVIAYQSGAAYRMGAEDDTEFSESFSASERFGQLLGHSMYFYTKRCTHPVKFVCPDFALKDIKLIPKYESIRPDQWGCNYWWLEYGGNLDTIHDTEIIRTELLKVIYGAWNYIKNSGKFPEADNLTLEWVGNIPGKRESRRFEGLYMLNQNDIIHQRIFDDAVAFGGWAIDLHPSDGLYSALPSCTQFHSKGIYSIPYRCYVSRDIDNLFLAGRTISVSHVAFGSTRVMATAGSGGQAVGIAAALCRKLSCLPADLLEKDHIRLLQQKLNLIGQSIPGTKLNPKENLASDARICVSSELKLSELPGNGEWLRLDYGAAQLLPLRAGVSYSVGALCRSAGKTRVTVELRKSGRKGNFTPDVLLERREMELEGGIRKLIVPISPLEKEDAYVFLIFRANPDVEIALSETRLSGILSLFNKFNLKVGNKGKQDPPKDSGFDSFEFWCPERRPGGKNMALSITPALDVFGSGNLVDGTTRPTCMPNAWIADLEDREPLISLSWDQPRRIKRVRLFLDNDFDHAMESVQYGHPEDMMPFCLRDISIETEEGERYGQVKDNHNTIVSFEGNALTRGLRIKVAKPLENVPASLFQIYID